MTALPSAAGRVLRSCLARLDSPFDGEVVAAARASGNILRKNDLSFDDLAPHVVQARPSPQGSGHGCGMQAVSPISSTQRRASVLLWSRLSFTKFEQDVLATLVDRRIASPRQLEILRQCEAKAERAANAREGAA